MGTVRLQNKLERSLHFYCLNAIQVPNKMTQISIAQKATIEISQNNANSIFLVTLLIGNLLVSYHDDFDKWFVNGTYTIDIQRSDNYLTFQSEHNTINFKPISQVLCKEV